MDAKLIEKLRQKYTKNPPEGMTPSLVKNMTDSDLLDMHYFLTEDDDLDDDEFEVCHARLCSGSFYQEFDGSRTFLL